MLPGETENQVFATEGGHTEFPCMDDEDWEIKEYISKKLGKLDRFSVARFLCEPGLDWTQ